MDMLHLMVVGQKFPSSQLPDSILGQLEYKGTFNPSSGYPA